MMEEKVHKWYGIIMENRSGINLILCFFGLVLDYVGLGKAMDSID